METAKQFDALMRSGRFHEAFGYLTDDFSWTGPRRSMDKAGWWEQVSKLPPKERTSAAFEDFQPGMDDLSVCRRGRKRIMFMNVEFVQTIQTTSEGKIRSISFERA